MSSKKRKTIYKGKVIRRYVSADPEVVELLTEAQYLIKYGIADLPAKDWFVSRDRWLVEFGNLLLPITTNTPED